MAPHLLVFFHIRQRAIGTTADPISTPITSCTPPKMALLNVTYINMMNVRIDYINGKQLQSGSWDGLTTSYASDDVTSASLHVAAEPM